MGVIFTGDFMGPVARLFNRIIAICGLRGTQRPRNTPENLDQSVLDEVLREADYLRRQQVDVRKLEEGERPGLPKRADE